MHAASVARRAKRASVAHAEPRLPCCTRACPRRAGAAAAQPQLGELQPHALHLSVGGSQLAVGKVQRALQCGTLCLRCLEGTLPARCQIGLAGCQQLFPQLALLVYLGGQQRRTLLGSFKLQTAQQGAVETNLRR